MSPAELEAWRSLAIEQRTLWKLKRVIESELETIARRMEELALGLGPDKEGPPRLTNKGTN